MFERIFDVSQSVFKNSEILFAFNRSRGEGTQHNQAIQRHATYSRGTGGGPPTPPAPGKFFNDWTFNDRPFNDQTFNDQTSNDQTSNDQTFNDRTFNASVQS